MDISGDGLSIGRHQIAGPISIGWVNAERNMLSLIPIHAVRVVEVDHQGHLAGVIILFLAAGVEAQSLRRIQYDYAIGYASEIFQGILIAVGVRLSLQRDDLVIVVCADSAGKHNTIPIGGKRIVVILLGRRPLT